MFSVNGGGRAGFLLNNQDLDVNSAATNISPQMKMIINYIKLTQCLQYKKKLQKCNIPGSYSISRYVYELGDHL